MHDFTDFYFYVFIKINNKKGAFMEFIDKISELKERAENLKENLKTEEATKNALVMPFLNALGYDVFNPLEVVPEYIADSRFKKDEKVDYAILLDNKPTILIECKRVDNEKLDIKKFGGQLFKYFTASKAKFIIFTNGIIYKFFSDVEEPNILDKEPFFFFNLLNFKPNQIKTLEAFCKENFDIDKAFSSAGDLKYIRAFEEILEDEYRTPSDDFVKYLLDKSNIYEGIKTSKVIEKHKKTAIEAFNLFMSKVMKTSLDFKISSKDDNKQDNKNEIITTIEELEGYAVVKSLLYDVINVKRVTYRDTVSYFNILLDDNIRKTVCRLYFNRSTKYIAFIEGNKEVKNEINGVNGIFAYKNQIIKKITEIEEKYCKNKNQ